MSAAVVKERVRRVSESEPVRVPADVLEGLEAVRRHLGTNVLDVATIRYFANERGRRALVVWIDRCPEEYGRGLLGGFQAASSRYTAPLGE
jgi:hypothetical protein